MTHFDVRIIGDFEILRLIDWGVQNEPAQKNGVFATNYFIILKCGLINSWFNVTKTQMTKFILFESVWVLLENDFFPWASLRSQIIWHSLKNLKAFKKKNLEEVVYSDSLLFVILHPTINLAFIIKLDTL